MVPLTQVTVLSAIRKPVRGAVTIAIAKLTQVTTADPVNPDAIRLAMDALNDKAAALHAKDQAMEEALIAETDDAEMLETVLSDEHASTEEYRDKVRAALYKAHTTLSALDTPLPSSANNSTTPGNSAPHGPTAHPVLTSPPVTTAFKLPEMKLATGDPRVTPSVTVLFVKTDVAHLREPHGLGVRENPNAIDPPYPPWPPSPSRPRGHPSC